MHARLSSSKNGPPPARVPPRVAPRQAGNKRKAEEGEGFKPPRRPEGLGLRLSFKDEDGWARARKGKNEESKFREGRGRAGSSGRFSVCRSVRAGVQGWVTARSRVTARPFVSDRLLVIRYSSFSGRGHRPLRRPRPRFTACLSFLSSLARSNHKCNTNTFYFFPDTRNRLQRSHLDQACRPSTPRTRSRRCTSVTCLQYPDYLGLKDWWLTSELYLRRPRTTPNGASIGC
ncbi:hypothetical protein B0H16DRAFT_52700 [Mycena metata]|uniref:Uncharacterized protein n=1 Tax=Mycena metata TaxID=1033252 RepID=A0AAD7IFJ7_9AGAR|nr:hypothetical protein B0H16DRAFT_52700 [Mycena metata]